MLVAVFVWFASFFGYTITEAKHKKIKISFRYSSPTFGLGASFRPEDQGGSSFLNLGYETKLLRYKPKWGYHAAVRIYMGSSEFDYWAVDQADGYFSLNKEATGSVNDVSIPLGIIYNISETSGLYFDLAPYIKGFDKSSTAKVTTAFTIGMKFKLSAFGSGFSPHLIYEFVDDYQQFGLFANFDLF